MLFSEKGHEDVEEAVCHQQAHQEVYEVISVKEELLVS